MSSLLRLLSFFSPDSLDPAVEVHLPTLANKKRLIHLHESAARTLTKEQGRTMMQALNSATQVFFVVVVVVVVFRFSVAFPLFLSLFLAYLSVFISSSSSEHHIQIRECYRKPAHLGSFIL